MTSGGGVVACAGVPMAKARNAEISIPLSGAPKLRAVIHPPTVDCGSLLLTNGRTQQSRLARNNGRPSCGTEVGSADVVEVARCAGKPAGASCDMHRIIEDGVKPGCDHGTGGGCDIRQDHVAGLCDERMLDGENNRSVGTLGDI